jgi:hypothetical protein
LIFIEPQLLKAEEKSKFKEVLTIIVPKNWHKKSPANFTGL